MLSAVISRLNRDGPPSEFTHVVIGRNQFLPGCWTELLSSSLAVGWRLPLVSCEVDLSMESIAHVWAASFTSVNKPEVKREF